MRRLCLPLISAFVGTCVGLNSLSPRLWALYLLPGPWCDPAPVRPLAGIFVVVVTMFYLYLVDDERRPVVGAWHRIGVGSVAGVIVAAIANGSGELYALLAFVGALLGFIGFRWLKHVPF